MLFKSLRAPKANLSIDTSKSNYNIGETIEGKVTFASQEAFDADEIRVELAATERLKPGGGFLKDDQENAETRIYSAITQNAPVSPSNEYAMYRGQKRVSARFSASPGSNQQLTFDLQIPLKMGPTYQGMRKDGRWLQRSWSLKAIVAVGGRPDVDLKKEIYVSLPPSQGSFSQSCAATSEAIGNVSEAATIPTASITQQEAQKEIVSCCPKCGASISPNQEDLMVTCRYCGFTVALADKEEIRTHSMLENHLFTQQAVEAAQRYMDKGIFRAGVAREAQITQVKLRYLPFWTFPVTTYTAYSGSTGTGLAGEMQQVENAFADKRATKFSKFGSLMKAGASAFLESQAKNQGPRTVSSSFSSSYCWPVMGRRSAISEINYYDVPAARKIPFDAGRIASDAEFLNAEFKQEEARLKAAAEVERRERQRAAGKVDCLQSCNVNANVGEGELVHAPVWFVYYCLNGENYSILVDGSEGKVLGGGKPLFHV